MLCGPNRGLRLWSVELLYVWRFPLRLKCAVYGSYVRPAPLYGSKAWCLKESEMGILRTTERSMERAMYVVQLKDRERSADLMFMLGLNETVDCTLQFNVECWCKQDCCLVEVNLTSLTYWGYYKILNIGVSLSFSINQSSFFSKQNVNKVSKVI